MASANDNVGSSALRLLGLCKLGSEDIGSKFNNCANNV